MLIVGTNLHIVNMTKVFLSSNFDMKDLGETDVILGISEQNGLVLTQSHYVEKLLKKFNHFDVEPVKTPYDPSFHLKKNKGSSVRQSNKLKSLEFNVYNALYSARYSICCK